MCACLRFPFGHQSHRLGDSSTDARHSIYRQGITRTLHAASTTPAPGRCAQSSRACARGDSASWGCLSPSHHVQHRTGKKRGREMGDVSTSKLLRLEVVKLTQRLYTIPPYLLDAVVLINLPPQSIWHCPRPFPP